jgi:hypothetical protein
MGQEFFINSEQLEDKIRSLLPSQGGAGAGFDLSASTQIIPVIDLTESAEGSQLREDLQRSFSLTSITRFNVNNTTTTIINTTGYFRLFGASHITGVGSIFVNLTDGVTTKTLLTVNGDGTPQIGNEYFDFMVFLSAGESVSVTSSGTTMSFIGVSRQIADISGNLVNP